MTSIGSGAKRWAGVRRYAEPALVAGVLAAIYLVAQPLTADYAAQTFRSGLFESEGIGAWNNLWFGGHHTPGYSVLFPYLASLIGPRVVGALAVFAAAMLFAGIAYRHWGDRARLGVIWFAAGASISLFTGRLSFALGVSIALAAVFASQRGWRPLAIFFAILTPLASPVAALFLACGAVAHAISERTRVGLEIGVAALGAAVLLTWAFPEGGTEPFVYSSFQPAILITLAVFLAIPKEERLLRCGVAVYGLALAGAFLIDSPMGGNATRMGALFLGPALAFGMWRRGNKLVLIMLAPLLVYWQWSPVVRDLETVYAQPSVENSFYKPVRQFLRDDMARTGERYRVEVVPVEHHWESAHMPKGIYIARGWERQLDRKLNPLFYEDENGPLTEDDYRLWLDDLAVGYVAVPHSDLDYAGEAEYRLITGGVDYLKVAFENEDWTVYRVVNPNPLAAGVGSRVKLNPQGFVANAEAAGSMTVRVRWTPYWSVKEGIGCVQESPTGFTQINVPDAGPIKIGVDVSPLRALSGGQRCASNPAYVSGWERVATKP